MAASAISGALAALVASDALGRLLSALLRVSLPRFSRFLCGAALLHLATFALGLAHQLTPLSLALTGAAALLLALALPTPPPAVGPRAPRWLWLVLAPYAVVYLVHALAPEISPDGLAYHVALPQRYLRDAALSFVPYNIYAQLSQAMEMLFTMAIAFGRPSSAALVHLAFLAALAAGLWRLERNAAAVILVACAPVVGIDASSAYTDVALAAVLVAIVANAKQGDARITGLLAGFAFAIKYTGFLAIPYALWATRFNWRVLPTAALVVLPWLARNAVNTGNPVAPFANALFPNAVFDPVLESAYVASLRAYAGFTGWATWPLEITTRGFVLAGLLGPVFLLAPLALRKPRWLAKAIFFALPYVSNIGTRFLIPAVPFLALGLAGALGRLAIPVALLHAVLSWPSIAGFYAHPQAWRLQEIQAPTETEATFYARRLREWPMAQVLQREVAPGDRVLTFSQFPDALTHADLVTAPLSRPGVELRQAVWYTHARQFLPTARRRYWIPGEPLRAVKLKSNTSIADVRAFHLLQPVPLRASAPEAIDGTILTRWNAFGHPRAFLELTADAPFDRLELILPADPTATVAFEPAGRLVESEATPPALDEDLIASAVRLLRAHRIRYLLLQDRDYGPALGKLTPETNMAGWPVKRIASDSGLWLYRLNATGPD